MATASSYIADQEYEADKARTLRAFVGFATSLLGDDQTYASDDMIAASPTGQYRIANPDGSSSVLGQPVSSQQGVFTTPQGLVISPVVLILGAVAAYFLLAD